ncbi:MAG: hypothetical protein NTZ82_05615 [Bacteroidetes bacterium]|nr:hypothetical protein [Bacteroidota bacterium]
MRLLFLYLFLAILGLSACQNSAVDPAQNTPDIALTIERLDQVMFQTDSLHLKDSLSVMQQKYPFLKEVLGKQILALDSNQWLPGVQNFISAYRPIYLESAVLHAPAQAQPQLQLLFKRVQYYFPRYKLPKKIIYFIGPLQGYGNSIGEDYMAIGLQMYLGSQSHWYQSEEFQKYFPPYLSQFFTTEYIPIAAAKNLIQDIAPNEMATHSLIVEMIELGKRQFILKKLLPQTSDASLLGYTSKQYDAIINAEPDIWNYLLKMNLVYSKNPTVINNMLGEAPFSIYFGNEVPGKAGLFIGYKIVQSWMAQQSNHKQDQLEALVQKSPEQLFAESKYHP